MVISLGGIQYNLTFFITGAVGVLFFTLYIAFVSNITHIKNEALALRWKYSIGFAVAAGCSLEALLFFRAMTLHFGEAAGIFEQMMAIGKAAFPPLACIIPFMFIVTIGAYFQLNWSAFLWDRGIKSLKSK